MNKLVQVNEKIVFSNLIHLKHIVFEVTEKCNLNCKYCALSDLYKTYDVRKNRDLPFHKAKLMIDHLIDLWIDNHQQDTVFPVAVGFYGGEPLMNVPLIRKIIEYLEQSKITCRKFHYSMTTNAMLLNQHMDFLAEKDFALTISLDGDEKAQSYRMNHSGKNSFNQVFRNVKLLQDKYPDYFNKSVGFISILHNRNDVEPIYHFFETNFNKEPKISTLSDSGINEDKKEVFQKMFQNKSMSIRKSKRCEEILSKHFLESPNGYKLSKYLYNLSGNIFYNYNELILSKLNNDILYTGTCLPFAKKLFVAVNGKILPCERIDHDFALGFVHDDFVELDYQHVADRHNYYLSKCTHQCISCGHNKLCPQCIYQIDDIRNESLDCKDYCTEDDAEKEKYFIFDYLCRHPEYYEKVLNEITFRL